MKTLRAMLLTPALLAFACSSESASSTNEPAANTVIRDYDVTLSSDKLPVLQGTSASIDVTVTRRAGFTAPVTIALAGLPSGASAAPVTIAGDKATLTVVAEASAPHSLPTDVAIEDKKLTVTIYGKPGTLDTSFSGGVLPVGDGDDYGYALATQSDGKILIAGRAAENLGDFAVVRLGRDGQLDATFGKGGKVMTDIAGKADTANAIAVQADGKIVVAGTSNGDFALVRYQANGELDTTFGTGGKVTTALSEDADGANAILLEEDGSIIVGGDANTTSSTNGVDFALARYAADGKLIWKVTNPIAAGAARDSIYALAKQNVDGKPFIVAAGGEGDFAIARYDLDGKLVSKTAPPFESAIGAARAVAVDANGNIVVAGHRGHHFALVRLDPAGVLDETFGDKGKVITAVSPENWDEAQAVAIEDDGKIVVGGWANEGAGTSANFALARYDATGKLDPVFGGTGIVISEIATKGKNDTANAIVLQSDERVPTTRVLVSGFASTSNSDFAVARYWR